LYKEFLGEANGHKAHEFLPPIIQTRAISSKANNESFTIMVSKSRMAAIKKAPDPNKGSGAMI
jgi:hypothetical protein